MSLRLLLDSFDHHGNDLLEVAHNPIVGYGKDRSIRIGIDGYDLCRLFHTSPVLDCPADSDGDIVLPVGPDV